MYRQLSRNSEIAWRQLSEVGSQAGWDCSEVHITVRAEVKPCLLTWQINAEHYAAAFITRDQKNNCLKSIVLPQVDDKTSPQCFLSSVAMEALAFIPRRGMLPCLHYICICSQYL